MGNYLCTFFRTLWSYFQRYFMESFADIFRSLLDKITGKKREQCRTDEISYDVQNNTLDESAMEAQESILTTPLTGQCRSTQTLPLVESDKWEDSRAVGSVSPLTTPPPSANAPQEETSLWEDVDVNAKKRLIRKTDQEKIDVIMDAFRRNDVAWMNHKLEDLKQGSSKNSTPKSLEQEQEDQNSEFIYANPDYEWVDEFKENPPPQNKTLRLREPKWSELTNEISRRYTKNTPSFLNASTSTPLSQNVNSLLYKEVGLRPMNPAYYKIAYDCDSDDEPTTSQNTHNAHQNPAKSGIKKKIANRRKAKGGSSRHRRRH
ncbi:unnamed protein product [Cylicocyclus nassatus]|uniref:Uncharacterized protein n=1 Tax=Cylicocyclus nassatus TaxID=53992 RepID=A0AA36MCN9_CYLNA|nr:unnamed protein product [Cylicocyclus nassatus]